MRLLQHCAVPRICALTGWHALVYHYGHPWALPYLPEAVDAACPRLPRRRLRQSPRGYYLLKTPYGPVRIWIEDVRPELEGQCDEGKWVLVVGLSRALEHIRRRGPRREWLKLIPTYVETFQRTLASYVDCVKTRPVTP